MKNSPINPDAVYSREEAAELLGVSLSTVKRLIAAAFVKPEGVGVQPLGCSAFRP